MRCVLVLRQKLRQVNPMNSCEAQTTDFEIITTFQRLIGLCPSVKLSKIQFIGCVLSIYDAYALNDQERHKEIHEKLMQALYDRGGISAHDAEALFSLKGDLSRRFQLTWELASDLDRATVLWMDYLVFKNYWPGLQYYNLALQSKTQLALGTPEEIIWCASFKIPEPLKASKAKPQIDPNFTFDSIDENFPVFYQEFLELRDLCKILRYSQFQLIGCLLSRRDIYKKENPQTQIFDDSLTVKLLRGMGVDQLTAHLLICEDDIESQFKRVWAMLSDREKALALTTDYERFDNFWPKFDVYSRALSPYIKFSEKAVQRTCDDDFDLL